MAKKTEYFYQTFPSFVFRTPCFPFDARLDDEFVHGIFSEALFLASPELYRESGKEGEISEKDKLKQDITFYKYMSRARSRCTPFGLFAGCSVGRWGTGTDIRLLGPIESRRCTRLDMNYVCALIQYLEKQPEIRNQLVYYTNDSLYEHGGGLRYVEYSFRKAKRVYELGSMEKSDYLQRVLDRAERGATIEELSQLLVNEEVSHDDAHGFVLALIEFQLLKSDLEAGVTGEETLNLLLERLAKLDNVDVWLRPLQTVRTVLNEIDKNPIGSTLGLYDRIVSQVSKFDLPFEPKYLFQTDLFKPARAVVDEAIRDELYQVVSFLNRITPRPDETHMIRFRNAFLKRYEQAEVPLMEVLDNDLGLGYPIREGDTGDINSLVDDLVFANAVDRSSHLIPWYPIDSLLLRKYCEALQNQACEIVLRDEDVTDYPIHWEDLPDTFSVMCKMLGGKPGSFYVQSCGGVSAGNLLGRFCHLDPAIHALVRSITKKEQELKPDVICAEIVHLPEARIGNILSRPVLREYEIPYLAQAGVDVAHQLKVSDLIVSVRNNRVVIRSMTQGKEVFPHLTTAHNYSLRALPVYQFLCDLQSQDLRVNLGFRWGVWANNVDYLPRVTYRNHILARQRWRFSSEEFKTLHTLEDGLLSEALKNIVQNRGLSRYFVVSDSDNELLIDTRDPISIRAFLNHIRRRNKFYIEEFLFDDLQCRELCGGYTNEFIFAFHRTK